MNVNFYIPVENGKPRRIGNPYCSRGASADHGQIPDLWYTNYFQLQILIQDQLLI